MGVGCLLSPVACAATSVGRATLGDLFGAMTQWVTDSVSWFLTGTGHVLGASSDATSVVHAAGSEFALLTPFAAPLALVGLLVSVVVSLRYGDGAHALRAAFVAVPLAAAGLALAQPVAALVLRVVDQMSATAASQVDLRATHLADTLTSLPSSTPGFGLFVMALLVVVGAVALWCELVVRAVALATLVALAPVVIALSVLPPARRAGLRLLETFLAVAASKFVVVVILALGLDLASGTGAAPIVAGAVALALATLAPLALVRVVPLLEGSALHQLEGMRQRASAGLRATTTSPGWRAASRLLPDPPEPQPDVEPEDLGIPMAEGGPILEVPVRRGPPPRPPVYPSAPRRGHEVITSDHLGPVVSWEWDDE